MLETTGGEGRSHTGWRLDSGVAGDPRIWEREASGFPRALLRSQLQAHTLPLQTGTRPAEVARPGGHARETPGPQTPHGGLPAPCKAAVSDPHSRIPSPATSSQVPRPQPPRTSSRAGSWTEAAEDQTPKSSKAPPLSRLQSRPASSAPDSAAVRGSRVVAAPSETR